MKLVRCLAVATLTFGLAAIAFAAGDPPANPNPAATTTGSGAPTVAPAAADPAAGLADIPENQEERAAILSGELKLIVPEGTAPAPTVDAARVARRNALDAVLAEQDAKVQSLADRLANATRSEDRLALEKDIEQEKLATSRRLLELQLDFATRDGDQARIEQIQAAITAWDAPAPVYTPVERPVPATSGR